MIRATKTKRGDINGGYVVEYVQLFDHEITDDEANADAIEQLTGAIKHLLKIRDLTAVGEFEIHHNYLNLDKKHGYCLSCLGS